MEKLVGKFKFTVPEGHAQAGETIEKAFDYEKCQTVEEATAKMEEKKLDIVGMVNDVLKSNARSNAYQAALLPYRATDVPEENIVERMIRDYIRLGFSEDVARQTVTGMLAQRPAEGQ